MRARPSFLSAAYYRWDELTPRQRAQARAQFGEAPSGQLYAVSDRTAAVIGLGGEPGTAASKLRRVW